MSDSLALINKIFTRGEVDIPRFYDYTHAAPESQEEEEPEKKAEEIISRFDKLRRK